MTYQSIDAFLSYFESIHKRTARLLPLIPKDKLEQRPFERNFSFGDIIRHVASIERHMFVALTIGEANRYAGHGQDLADGFDAVMRYYERLHTESVEQLATLKDDDLLKKCLTPSGVSISTWKWLRAMIEHEIHHRGQLYLMLSAVEIRTPPIFGLTSEEVLEKAH